MKESSTEVINEVPIVNHQDVKLKIGHFLKVYGPGLIVMLADTDAGCLITAAQSGAQWGMQWFYHNYYLFQSCMQRKK